MAQKSDDARTVPNLPKRVRTKDHRLVVTLSDHYRDTIKGDNPWDRIAGATDLKSVLAALGYTLPREAYFPSPDQYAHRPLKTLFVPAKLQTEPPYQKDCSVRYAAPRSCWLYVRDLYTVPLNLTAAESLVVRYSLHCGTGRTIVDFCEIVSQSNEEPGQYTPPQEIMVPPLGVLVIDFFNQDQYSEAIVGLHGWQWLVPEALERGGPPKAMPLPGGRGASP